MEAMTIQPEPYVLSNLENRAARIDGDVAIPLDFEGIGNRVLVQIAGETTPPRLSLQSRRTPEAPLF